MTKYSKFNSLYLPDFYVVEQREGNICRFPHTEQLPKLLRALNLEFLAGLPPRIARVDERGNGYTKGLKHGAALLFCSIVNQARRDQIRLHALVDRNLVARISIVQQIVEHRPLGPLHRFKFYAGEDLFQPTYINGRWISFSGHVIERFSERVPNRVGTDLKNFFDGFFNNPISVMKCNKSTAFVIPYDGSILAFPVRLSDAELFLPTCLTVDQINELEPLFPPLAYTHTYDQTYEMPEARNWDTTTWQLGLQKRWEEKRPLELQEESGIHKARWSEIAHKIIDLEKCMGHGEGSRILFRDNIPGLDILRLKPGEPEPILNIPEALKIRLPAIDWDILLPAHKAANPAWYASALHTVQP